MLHEVRINSFQTKLKSEQLLSEIKTLGFNSIRSIEAIKVYRFHGWEKDIVEQFAKQVLCHEDDQWAVDSELPLIGKKIEIALKKGVMNPEEASLEKIRLDLGYEPFDQICTSWEYFIDGLESDSQHQAIIDRLLLNKTVEEIITVKPAMRIASTPTNQLQAQIVSIRALDQTSLNQLSADRCLHLKLHEMKAIQEQFIFLHRDPYDVELETIAQTWSEHCSHKTFKAPLNINGKQKEPLFTRLKHVATLYSKDVVSAFEDNAGAYDFYDDYALLAKVETHNSPSAIEPYGGAATGSGGVFRDIMGTGLGAKVIASTDVFCVAPPNLSYEALPSGCLHPRFLLRNLVAGVRDYGNRMGIPTNNGSVHMHTDFRAKPTVIVGAYGIAPKKYCNKGEPKSSDAIIVIGGKTGRDGIHGATFSSGQMTQETITVNACSVQIGNPIEEKRMADALLACRDAGLIRAITDCGAGGFSSAIGEMASEIGAQVYLEKAPLKYDGLLPWEIWVSESQERMICAVEPENVNEFIKICSSYNTQATEIGEFTSDKKLHVFYNEQLVCNLSMEFLHDGLPIHERIGIYQHEKQKTTEIESTSFYAQLSQIDFTDLYHYVIGHWNVCSKEAIVRQYDHTVQGTNVLLPYGGIHQDAPNNAAILKPLLDKPYGMIIAHGLNPVMNRIDTYDGAWWALLEALSNIIAVGGNYQATALIDNFIWPYPNEKFLGMLDAAIDACIDGMHTFKIPFISGKDSLSSTYRFADGKLLHIPPVLCISAMSKIDDIKNTVSSDLKDEGECLLLLNDVSENVGGTILDEYLQSQNIIAPKSLQQVPLPDKQKTVEWFDLIFELIQKNYISALHDVSEGGIAVTIAEMCFGSDKGAYLDMSSLNYPKEIAFFSETPGCFIAQVKEELFDAYPELRSRIIGTVCHNPTITIRDKYGEQSIDCNQLKTHWQMPLQKVMQ